ncbi:hypothetical protein FAES_3267 [Fibrella aestuarina BUZ 2]|uniref:Uncharacterized protein n=1 Tax=Fibrella aestuarina BUZ 2 TaxID=1166018 RepID=I0KAX3_9BACT|nr:hypothetical protein [Fibrella aestuarina]CCH01276.1 hypothetical protein FAES_3267 [Fibrella aestuarina BUZ 2]
MNVSDITPAQLARLTSDFNQMAKQPVQVEIISETAYAYGTELAVLRIWSKYKASPKTAYGYSTNLNTWFFSLTLGPATEVSVWSDQITSIREASAKAILSRLEQEQDCTLYLLPACEILHTDGAFTYALRGIESLGAELESQIQLSYDDGSFDVVCDLTDLSTDALVHLAEWIQQPVHPSVEATLDEALTEAVDTFMDLYADVIAANGLDIKAVFDWWSENDYKWPHTKFEALKQAIAQRVLAA